MIQSITIVARCATTSLVPCSAIIINFLAFVGIIKDPSRGALNTCIIFPCSAANITYLVCAIIYKASPVTKAIVLLTI